GPNAIISLQHPLIGYYIPLSPSTASSGPRVYAGISVESPGDSVSPPSTTASGFKSFSRCPDVAAQIRWQDNTCGHVQFATLFRDVGTEGPGLRDDTFGWGLHLSAVYHPFNDGSFRSNDFLAASIIYGAGIGNYVLDLNGFDGPDAAFGANRYL